MSLSTTTMETTTKTYGTTDEFVLNTHTSDARRVQRGGGRIWVECVADGDGEFTRLRDIPAAEIDNRAMTIAWTHDLHRPATTYRKFAFNSRAGVLVCYAFRERKGLGDLMERTPHNDAGLRQLLARAGTEESRRKGDAVFLMMEERGNETLYLARTNVRVMARMPVCYYGIQMEAPTVRMSAGGLVVRARMVMRWSPVRTETETERYVLPDNRMPMVAERPSGMDVEWRFADGTDARMNLFDDDYVARAERWRRECELAFTFVEHIGRMKNGKWGTDADHLPDVRSRVTPDIGLSSLSTKAGRKPSGNETIERLVERRRALKEAIAEAVFAPARVERMDAAYGDDWMERV